jgi:hypothetical protein
VCSHHPHVPAFSRSPDMDTVPHTTTETGGGTTVGARSLEGEYLEKHRNLY